MDIRLLGSVSVEDGSASIEIDSPKERAALITLALDPGRAISPSRLIEGLWGSSPPDTADKTLQWHVSRLRKTIGADTLATTSTGYLLDIDPSGVDAIEFESLLKSGSTALADGRPRDAVDDLEHAHVLWRGEPFGDLADSEYRTGQQRRFGELFLLLQELRFEARLALGEHHHLIPDLEAFVAEHPYREQPWMLLMLALYRADRQVGALRTYQRLRTRLQDDLGIDPSAAAATLEERILRRDPQLDLVPPPPSHNLPVRATSFVGREQEVASVISAVSEHRLVSIIGAGGIGKSRLASQSGAEMLHDFPDGVWWVDLAPVTSDEEVAARVALEIRAPLSAAPDPETAITMHLRNRTALIVLDNCEHLCEGAGYVARHLLAAGPASRVLTTTRVALAIPGETRIVVPPLSHDADEEALSPAARLFIDRSQTASGKAPEDGELAAVADLVACVDGMPLSIELAAARSTLLTPSEMAAHLTGSVDLPGSDSGGTEGRHHSVRRVLDWSYTLLSEDDRAAFDVLGVFRGSFDLEAASAVLGSGTTPAETLSTVGHLLDASMLTATTGRENSRRFRLLEPMRLYALSHLSDETRRAASQRHCDHFRTTLGEPAPLNQPDVIGWRELLWEEDDNLMSAIDWSLENEDASQTLVFADAIGQSLYRRGENTRCVDLMTRFIELGASAPPGLVAEARGAIVWPAFLIGRADIAFRENGLALTEAEQAGNTTLFGWSKWNTAHMLVLGAADFEQAEPLYDETIEMIQDHPEDFGSLSALAHAGRAQGRALAGLAAPTDREDLAIAEERALAINDLSGVAHAFLARWLVEFRDDQFEEAYASAEQNVRFAEAAKDPVYQHIGLSGMATALQLLGETEAAYNVEFRSVRVCQLTNNIMQLGVSLIGLGVIAMSIGEWETGAKLWGAGRALAAPWPVFQQKHQPDIEACRDALGVRFDEFVREGEGLSPDAAVALAAALPIE